jgi:succinyl-diaminopimelate desuccinylase
VELKGAAGHAASPAAGNNALTALLRLIELLPLAAGPAADRMHALARLFPHGDWRGEALKVAMSDEESGSLTLSLDVLNYKDGKIEGIFDCRAPLCATEENLTCVMRKALAEAGFSMEEGGMTPAHAVSADSFFVRTLLDCYELYSGRKGKTLAIGGGTYVHELERGVAFGCAEEGVDTHMHGDDEYMKISIMVMSAKIFADAILRLCM